MNLKMKKGYSLVEILIVVAIIAVLTLIILATLGRARSQTRDARRMDDIKQIKGALENYFSTCYTYPASGGTNSLDILQTSPVGCPSYRPALTRVPRDPLTNASYFYYFDSPTGVGKRFHVCALLENLPTSVGGKAGRDRFTISDPCDGNEITEPNVRIFDVVGGVY